MDATGAGGSSRAQGEQQAASFSECNICFELATEPVVTVCGHLFCWPCLYKWLHMNAGGKTCPVCKAGVEEDKVIPLYGRGGGGQDPRKKQQQPIPNRPAGQRPEAQRNPQGQFPGSSPFGFFDNGAVPGQAQFGNFHLSAGFGLFPALLGLQFQALSGPQGAAGNNMAAPQPRDAQAAVEQQQRQHLSRLLFTLASLVVLCVLFF